MSREIEQALERIERDPSIPRVSREDAVGAVSDFLRSKGMTASVRGISNRTGLTLSQVQGAIANLRQSGDVTRARVRRRARLAGEKDRVIPGYVWSF